jgi:predicted DNA-binding transcriptional regulator AlpA
VRRTARSNADAAANTPIFLNGPSVCARLGVSRWTWARWVRSGDAPRPSALPGHPKWSLQSIEQFERGLVVGRGLAQAAARSRRASGPAASRPASVPASSWDASSPSTGNAV